MKLCKFIIVLAFAFVLIGCNAPKDEEPVLSLIVDNFLLRPGDKAVIVPVIEGTDDEAVFTSKNESIATVNAGEISAISEGDTEITVSLKNFPDVAQTVYIQVRSEARLIMEWAIEQIGNEADFNAMLPKTHPDYPGSSITYHSDNPDIITDEGKIRQKEYNQTVGLAITVHYNGESKEQNVTITVIGYAYGLVADKFLSQFSSKITRNYNVSTSNSTYPNAIIEWSSSNPDIFSDEGVYTKPDKNTVITITVTVAFEGIDSVRQFTKEVTVQGISIFEKADTVREWVLDQLDIGQTVDQDLELPLRYEEYNANLVWQSDKPRIVNEYGVITPSDFNQLVSLRCNVIIGTESASFYIEFEVIGKVQTDKWTAIEVFLDKISKEEIATKRYSVDGVGPSYWAYNNGYLHFYQNEFSEILDGYVDRKITRTRPGYIKSATRWIVVHDTANNKPGSGAEMHKDYIQNGPESVSWHYSVDDTLIYQHIPDEEVAWHAGDRDGNYYGIGIETCINPESDYTVVMRKTAKLVSELMNEFHLTLYDIRQHYFFSGKDCPHLMRSQNRWNEFIELVEMEYFAIANLQGVQFVWESLSPSILDNTGKVYNHPGIATDITYKVTVTYEGTTKSYTYISRLLPQSWL